MVPYLQWLSLERDCRIFQNKSVPDIVKEVLQDSKLPTDRFDFRLKGSYAPVEYCVQYRETDLDFVSRLLEEEGIFYFFEHSDKKHLLVFADGTVAYKEIAGESGVTYNFSQGMAPKEECIYRFAFSRQVRSGKMTREGLQLREAGAGPEEGRPGEGPREARGVRLPGAVRGAGPWEASVEGPARGVDDVLRDGGRGEHVRPAGSRVQVLA